MLVEFCEKNRWLKCDALLTGRPKYKKASVAPTAGPTNCIRLVPQRRDYFMCGDWHHRSQSRNCVLMTGNWLATRADCGRPTQWKCATARFCTCAVRTAHSSQNAGFFFFFVWQCAKVYRLTPKHKYVVYKWSIVMTDVSFWNWSVRKEIAAQRVICCSRPESTITRLHIPDLSAEQRFAIMLCFFFSAKLVTQCCFWSAVTTEWICSLCTVHRLVGGYRVSK